VIDRSGFTTMPLEKAARTSCETDFGGFTVPNRENTLFTSHLTRLAPVNSMDGLRVLLRQRVKLRPVGRPLNF
jgi:hypothetical protein